jgi:4-oxalomesaconate hydratase
VIEGKRLLVIGAHAADFVWRSAGVVALTTSEGGDALVVALSYGERGESSDLWDLPNQTIENVKRVRHAEAAEAAQLLGAKLECLDLGDFPLVVDRPALDRLTTMIRSYAPDAIITHLPRDPFNPDHPVAYAAVEKARLLAMSGEPGAARPKVRPSRFFCFEPHLPELCSFEPDAFVDITKVYEKKVAAMNAMTAQRHLVEQYRARAEYRAEYIRRLTGHMEVQYAEAFVRMLPQLVTDL